MSVQFKDYYRILGVDRSASPDQIKRAYRKLAAQYHPDRHQGDPKMADKFKEINEAYEVLRDPEKRRKYDTLGRNWKQGQTFDPEDIFDLFGGRGRAASGSGGGFQYEPGGGFSDFFEALFGNAFGERSRPGAGRGADFSARGRMRPSTVETSRGSSGHIETRMTISLEEALRGTTRRINFNRAEASGQNVRQSFDVKIPAGIRDGQKIRLRGQGSSVGRRNGDILISIQIAPHPTYRIEGGNLEADLPLAPWEAALGTTIKAPTPEGPVSLKVPPGIQSGKRMRVRGRGYYDRNGNRGDLMLRVMIQNPPRLRPEERELYEKLSRTCRFSPRKKDSFPQ